MPKSPLAPGRQRRGLAQRTAAAPPVHLSAESSSVLSVNVGGGGGGSSGGGGGGVGGGLGVGLVGGMKKSATTGIVYIIY